MDTAVGLVKSYLELTGYFVLAELPVRERAGEQYRDVTDLDIVAVRFPQQSRALTLARALHLFLGSDPELGLEDGLIDAIVGEVKEGKPTVNPALRRTETVELALHRLGCCPPNEATEVAQLIIADGERRMKMPGHLECRVRIVAFAGQGTSARPGVAVITLAHCARYIEERLAESPDMTGTQFKDPVLGLFALLSKVHQGHAAAIDTRRPATAAAPAASRAPSCPRAGGIGRVDGHQA